MLYRRQLRDFSSSSRRDAAAAVRLLSSPFVKIILRRTAEIKVHSYFIASTDMSQGDESRSRVHRACIRRWTASRGKRHESVVRRALQVIFGNIPYDEARRTCNDLSLAERRHELGKRFFQRIIKDTSNVLFYLLPAKRDVQLTTRLRCARQYPAVYVRTNRYKNSFILFGLNHFQ